MLRLWYYFVIKGAKMLRNRSNLCKNSIMSVYQIPNPPEKDTSMALL